MAIEMTPGIYRARVNHCLVPSEDSGESLRDRLESARFAGTPHMFATPEAFLEAWKEGYITCNSVLDSISKGFELYWTTLDQEDPAYPVTRRTHDDEIGDVLLATDSNGISDIWHRMNLGVSDIPRERVLVYKANEEAQSNAQHWNGARLSATERFYGSLQNRFPLESLNPAKAMDQQWTVMGFSPEQVYDAFKQMGFVFPE